MAYEVAEGLEKPQTSFHTQTKLPGTPPNISLEISKWDVSKPSLNIYIQFSF